MTILLNAYRAYKLPYTLKGRGDRRPQPEICCSGGLRCNSVKEYIVSQAFENQLQWFQLVDGDYQQLIPDADGIIRSQMFPGLWLAVEPLLNNQMAQVLTVLQSGLNSPEHAAFVE
jgi:hypothetical protein